MIDFAYSIWLIIAILICLVPLYLAYCFICDIFETKKRNKDRIKE